MFRSFLTLLLFLPSAFSLETRSRRLGKSRRKATRKLMPDLSTKSTKSAKSEPLIQELTLKNSDEFFDISIGLAPLGLIDYYTCEETDDCTSYADFPPGFPVELPVSVTGGLWMDNGDVDFSTDGDQEDYWYTMHCTLLDDSLVEVIGQLAMIDIDDPATVPDTVDLPGKSSCNVDVCLGVDDDTGDPNCVYLRYSGEMNAKLKVADFFSDEKLRMKLPAFKATVIGGTGSYAASIGEASVELHKRFKKGSIELRTIPSDALEGLWDM